MLCHVFLYRLDLALSQLQDALPLFLSLFYRQSHCHSLLSRRIATSVLALCVHSSIHTETQHAAQSLCLQCAIDKMSASEWNCGEHPLCVSLLLRFCCPRCCVPLANNNHENIIPLPYVSADIEDLPPAVQEKLFDEVLDRDVQKGIQDVFIFYICYLQWLRHDGFLVTCDSSSAVTLV